MSFSVNSKKRFLSTTDIDGMSLPYRYRYRYFCNFFSEKTFFVFQLQLRRYSKTPFRSVMELYCGICHRDVSTSRNQDGKIPAKFSGAEPSPESELPPHEKLFIIQERHQQYHHISIQNEKYRQLIEKYLLPTSQNSEMYTLQCKTFELSRQLEIRQERKRQLLQKSILNGRGELDVFYFLT